MRREGGVVVAVGRFESLFVGWFQLEEFVEAGVELQTPSNSFAAALTDELLSAVRATRANGHGPSWETPLTRQGCVVLYRTLHRFAIVRPPPSGPCA